MKSLAALVTAVVLVLGLGLTAAVTLGDAPRAAAAPSRPFPEATKKKTPKPTASPTTQTPVPAPPSRRPVDEEGERWVQLAWVAGGGLLGSVLVFFGLGALLRRRRR